MVLDSEANKGIQPIVEDINASPVSMQLEEPTDVDNCTKLLEPLDLISRGSKEYFQAHQIFSFKCQ